jgi:Cu/Zn superoxide dismutase
MLGALVAAGAATAMLATGAAATPSPRGAGPLSDLQPATEEPTDGARARVRTQERDGATRVALRLRGLDAAAAGNRYGAHIHVGPCVAGDGAAAGPHYNAGGGVSEETEVWLDFVIGANGTAAASTTVPFVIAPGTAQSLVIHALPTDPTGAAGARIACLPVEF